MELKFAHICIRTRDLAATERFYTEALGMEKVFNFRRDGEVMGIYLRISDMSFIEVFEVPDVENHPSSIAHLCLETSDIDATTSELRARGVKVTDKKTGADGSYQVWFADPNGIQIELHQYTESSSQITGADAAIG